RTEAGGAALMERIMMPALNIDGIEGGGGIRAPNAVPTTARAAIDFRLVPDETPARVRRLVEAHVAKRGFHIVHADPTPQERARHFPIVRLDWEEGYAAIRTPMDSPVARDVIRVAREASQQPLVVVPTLGGSLPMDTFQDVLRVPLIVVPMVNHDNNQHAANENLRIQNLWDGIELYAVLYAGLGEQVK
ncbi:MAG TPA: peptidase dimerization domain-containing protein, partial [Gemmatimonadaceae bacterium]|nr:peptidase dimerization domain-containing protein [Gemmatimonadaceae bacterium]